MVHCLGVSNYLPLIDRLHLESWILPTQSLCCPYRHYGLIKREGPTGDEGDIVVAAGEAAGGRDRTDCGHSANGEIIDVGELERAGGRLRPRSEPLALFVSAEGPALPRRLSSLAVMLPLLSDGAIKAHIGRAGVNA